MLMTLAGSEGTAAGNETAAGTEAAEGDEPFATEENHEIPPAHAVLFPAFCLTIGAVVYYLLSRYLQALPFTAVMFLIGTLMGIGEALLDRDDQMNESLQLWVQIDSEVLLLIFLPGLIFKDSFGLNVHLFRVAILQCLNFVSPRITLTLSLYLALPYIRFAADRPSPWSWRALH